jgi:hypothetical protein
MQQAFAFGKQGIMARSPVALDGLGTEANGVGMEIGRSQRRVVFAHPGQGIPTVDGFAYFGQARFLFGAYGCQ